MIASDQLINLATNANGFAFDSVTGSSYQISKLGLEVIDLIKNGAESEEIARHIVNKYDVNEHTAERDLTIFVANLRALGLVEG